MKVKTWSFQEWTSDAEAVEVTRDKVRIWADRAHGCYCDVNPRTGRMVDVDGGEGFADLFVLKDWLAEVGA